MMLTFDGCEFKFWWLKGYGKERTNERKGTKVKESLYSLVGTYTQTTLNMLNISSLLFFQLLFVLLKTNKCKLRINRAAAASKETGGETGRKSNVYHHNNDSIVAILVFVLLWFHFIFYFGSVLFVDWVWICDCMRGGWMVFGICMHASLSRTQE